jgi:hypothetical protein
MATSEFGDRAVADGGKEGGRGVARLVAPAGRGEAPGEIRMAARFAEA